MKPKWLYRLEYQDSSCGLWYDGNGKWCFENGIGSLNDDCKTKTLPMDYDERYQQEGRNWFSSCSNKEDLLHWYSLEDAKELLSKGFVFTRYLATEYHEYPQETVFIKDTAIKREVIDLFDLFEKILDLPLKKVWYEMIESGEKTEEYREIKPYWCKRFLNMDTPLFSYRNGYQESNVKGYTHVRFRYGYTKRTMTFNIDEITIGVGNPKWGAPEEEVFIIKFS